MEYNAEDKNILTQNLWVLSANSISFWRYNSTYNMLQFCMTELDLIELNADYNHNIKNVIFITTDVHFPANVVLDRF